MRFKKPLLLSLLLFTMVYAAQAQGTNPNVILGQDTARRVITTAVPFLSISPDARGAGMGDVGVATSTDANAIHWNPSKLAFAETQWGMGMSYTPWLSGIVNDMWLFYGSFFTRINERQVMAFSMRYFNMGELQFTDTRGLPIQDFNPREVAFDGTFAFQLSQELSMAGTGRFIHSNLAGNVTNTGTNQDARPGNTVAVDFSMFYDKELNISSMPSKLAFGLNISNVGARITYNDPEQRDFIPTNLRLGSAFTGEIDEFNKFTIAFDVNKLMVPTPPIIDPNDGSIRRGRNPDRPLLSAMFGSFADAPDGFSEELKEFIWAIGAEYWYNDLFALRGGYYHEHAEKGDRQYFTLGLGLRYQVLGFDVAYLLPVKQRHPLENTLRFSILFGFDGNKGK
ncbi:MAG: type IX secretion system outer membrane channel protein PorV [Bernardetiaceae bacterium]|nr:type IX secretion system outer membrane channel protein PorV [Bernardetiaceae bacterium]